MPNNLICRKPVQETSAPLSGIASMVRPSFLVATETNVHAMDGDFRRIFSSDPADNSADALVVPRLASTQAR